MSPLMARVPARNGKGEPCGYVEYSMYVRMTEVVGGVRIPSEYWLRLDGVDDDPTVTVHYRVERGAPVVANVTVDGGNITPNVFDAIRRQFHNWGEWSQRAVMNTRAEDGWLTPGVSKDDRRAAETELKRRRGELKMARLREVAALYNATVEGGTAYATIADRFGKSEPTAARWVAEARAAGLDVKEPPRGRLKGAKK